MQMRQPPPSPAVLIGLETMQGLQAARILSRRGVPVVAVVEDPRHFNCTTRCCERIVPVTGDLVATLQFLGRRFDRPAVLFPCSDDSVLQVSRARQELKPWYQIRLPAAETVEMMIDKIRFYIFAREQGFSIPRTFVLDDEVDMEHALAKLTYPCILKPYYRDRGWNAQTSFKAFRASDGQELVALYRRYRPLTRRLIAQEWIAGPDSNLYSCNCYFDEKGEVQATFVARKLRQWPPHTGQSSLGEECRNDLVLEETLRFFRTAGFCGLGYLEMKRDERTGRHYLIEPNIGRPTGRSAIAEAGGVELLYTMYCDALGLPLPAQRVQQYRGVKWVHLRRDFQSALHDWRRGELTLGEWRRSWQGRKAYALFSWNDPAPFVGDLVRAGRLFLSREERQKRDFSRPLLAPAGDER